MSVEVCTESNLVADDKSLFGPIKLIIIQPTSFCNLDCTYCYLSSEERQVKNELSLDLIEPIFTNILQSQFVKEDLTIVWHAGEPLTMPISFYESAFEKIEQIRQKMHLEGLNIFHSFQTNGILINESWCDFFNKYKVRLGVSLDGPDFIHDTFRKTRTGLGTHRATMRGISLLQKKQVDFSVIAVLTSKSLDFVDEMVSFFIDNKIKRVGFNIDELEGSNNSCSFITDEQGIESKYRDFMQRFYELTQSSDVHLDIREFQIAKDFIENEIDVRMRQQSVPFGLLSIDSEGNFCTFSPELLGVDTTYGKFIFGNLLSESLESICQTAKFQKVNQDIQQGTQLCKNTCQYFSVCGGGAPGNKYFENGTFNSSETVYCKYTRQIITDVVLENVEKELGLRD